MPIVDAHEDIASNVLFYERDVRRSALETRRLEENQGDPERNGLAMVGVPEWLAGEVAVVCGTIFAPPAGQGSSNPYAYTDAQEAHEVGVAQLDVYRRLFDESEYVTPVTTRADLEAVLASWRTDEPRVGIVLLMEGADPIREPAEVAFWFERGVRMIGLSWSVGTRYAGGNSRAGGLTEAGRALLARMAEYDIILDLSHLAETSYFEALDRFEGSVVATHANPRALVPGPRQLSDEMILELAARDGVMGLVPYNAFLKPDWRREEGKQAVTLEAVVAAIDHVCQLVGDARHVGIGSDFDGGFGAESTPAEFDTVADLRRIGPALIEKGYTDAHVEAILSGNWVRVLEAALP
jgi:membrane dipeptidase